MKTTASVPSAAISAAAFIAALFILGATYVFAQVPSPLPEGVTVTTSSPTTTVSAGTGRTLVNFGLNYSGSGGIYVYSIPVTLTATGGANVSQLTNCQVYDNAINISLGSAALQQGSNMLSIPGGIRIQNGFQSNLSLRCDVASTFPSGGAFQFTVDSTAGSATSTPSLAISMSSVASNVQPGVSDATLANIMLDARQSGNDIQVSSLPLTVLTGSGAFAGNLTDCRVRNTGTNAILNSGANIPTLIASGTYVVRLDSPLTISRGTAVTLAVTCDVAPFTAAGGTFQINIDPAALGATVSGSSTAVTPTGTGTGTVITATPGATPTPTPTPTTTPPIVPGVPSAGAGGGSLATLLTLLFAGGAVTLAVYLRRRLA